MSNLYFFSAPGCGWSPCIDMEHYHALELAISMWPIKHEGWRLAKVSQYIHAAIMVAPIQ